MKALEGWPLGKAGSARSLGLELVCSGLVVISMCDIDVLVFE